MAKIIKLTPEYLDEVRREFEASLVNAKCADGKISFTKSFASVDRKATVYFTETAWAKMQALIREFDKEVAWHGVAYRGDDPEKDEYTITDILVYPQEVTGATVTTDQEKYQTWLMMHDDDVFNNIRMQGHSHVNMGTTPSGVDTSLYERILDQLDDTMFYIFLIYNKRGEKTYKIYDLAKNVLFETGDVTVKILGSGFDMDAFMKDAKTKVTNKVTTIQSAAGGYGGYGYGGYGGYSNPKPSTPSIAPAPASAASAPKTIPISSGAGSSGQDSVKKKSLSSGSTSKDGNRKGKQRKGKDKYTSKKHSGTGGSSYMTSAGFYDDRYYDTGYDDDDPYGSFGWRENNWC